jgi:ABC-2 type transport system permease protein
MSLYIRELKGNLKSFIIWTACIVSLTALFMAMYPSFAEQGAAVNEMLSGFSPQLMQMFGFDAVDFTQTMDYYGYVFQYVLLAVLIQFMLAGANLVSREEDSGTISFLYAKPVSRTSIAGTKFIAGLTQVAAFFVVYTAAAMAILSAVNRTGVDFGTVLLLDAAMALGQLMVMGVGMLLGVFVTRARTVMSASIGVILVLYMASMFANMQESLEWLKYFTPFQYFDAREILRSGCIEWVYVVLSAGVALAGLAASLVIYNRKDLKSDT